MKEVNRHISVERELKALSEGKSNSFAVKFGDKDLFSFLKITIKREACNAVRTFMITKEHLPNNKTNTTRFYLKEGGEIKWCSKVAENMHEVR